MSGNPANEFAATKARSRPSPTAAALLIGLLLLILPAHPALAGPADHEPAQVRRELGRILSAPEYNRVYAQSRTPESWREFWNKAVKAVGRFIRWLRESLSLRGEQAGRVASFVFACSVIAAFLALLALVIRRLWGRAREAQSEKLDAVRGGYGLPSARPLMAEAAKLAESGDYRGAFLRVYLASISHLDETGALRFERSRTNWEYLRELRNKGRDTVHDRLRPLTIDFDRKFYGREKCDRDDYLNALAVYEQISGEAAA